MIKLNETEVKKTLTQLSNELNVSKSSIYRKISKEPLASELGPYMETINNTLYIIGKGIEIIESSPEITRIRESAAVRSQQTSEYEDDPIVEVLQAAINTLREQLESKDKQLIAKDKQLSTKDEQLTAKDDQIKNLTNALRESQAVQMETARALQAAEALHNNTMKQLVDNSKKKKHWWNRKKTDDIIDVDAQNREGEN